MGHNVGKAAEIAVNNSNKKTATEQTPEQLVAALRGNLRANLYVPVHQTAALLAQYDSNHAILVQTTALLQDATKTIEILDAEKIVLLLDKDELNGALIAFQQEKKVMTDTIFGLTQKVQELQSEIDKVALAIHERDNPPELVVMTPLDPIDRQWLNSPETTDF